MYTNTLNKEVVVSIITPAYNSEKTIERTIKSVLNQTYDNIEYIIVDGKSNDSTLQIAEQYKKKFQEKGFVFKLISESDNGISDAFNKGVLLSTGAYVMIINSDDWLEENTIKTIVISLSQDYSIYCGDINLYENGSFVRTRKSKPSNIKWGMYVMHPTMCVKKDLYKHYQYNKKLKIAMDYDWLLNILSRKGTKIKYIPEVLANMELGGVSSNVQAMKAEEHIIIRRYFSKLHVILFLLRENILSIIGAVVNYIKK